MPARSERNTAPQAGSVSERGLDFGGEARAEEPKRPKSDGKKRAMSRRMACCRLKRRSRGRARLRDWSEKTKKVMRPPYLELSLPVAWFLSDWCFPFPLFRSGGLEIQFLRPLLVLSFRS